MHFLGASPSSLCSLAKVRPWGLWHSKTGGGGAGSGGSTEASDTSQLSWWGCYRAAGDKHTLGGWAWTKERECISAFSASLRKLNSSTQAAAENTVTPGEKDTTHISVLRRQG